MRNTAAVLLAASCAAPAWSDGMPDPGFGVGGRVTTNFGLFAWDEARAAVVQPDGRAVAAGFTRPTLEQSLMAVARYLPSGALDTSFDGDGLATVEFANGPDMSGAVGEALLQPDGKLVLVGAFRNPPPPTLHYALARLNADGSLDTSFGTGGKVLTPLAGAVSPGLAAVLQPDGRILVLGSTGTASDQVVALARYNADGSLDASFGTAGQTTVPSVAAFRPQAIALDPSGRILVAGTVGTSFGPFDFGLMRLLPDGTLDVTFSGDGLATSDFGGTERANSVVLQDDRILIAGYRTSPTTDFAIVRYLADGSPDPTFGGPGGLATADSGAAEIGEQLIVQPDGKLLIGGWTNDSGANDFILARFTSGGVHDATFGVGGFLRTDFAGSVDQAYALALAFPDRILAAGLTLASDQDFALARYIASTPVEVMSFSVE